jgi:hypothetical protein
METYGENEMKLHVNRRQASQAKETGSVTLTTLEPKGMRAVSILYPDRPRITVPSGE